jgi:outer membrane lipoprotein-sorting protein
MKPDKHVFTRFLGFGLVFLVVMLSAACGAKIIRGAAPMVRMNELSHQNDTITLQLSMRNINGVPLDVQSIDFSLTVDDDELFSYQGPANTNIVANGTETWSVEIEESQSSRDLLDSLENGEVKSLPYSLKGSIRSVDDGTLRFEYEGHIYPLPGRPGRFR